MMVNDIMIVNDILMVNDVMMVAVDVLLSRPCIKVAVKTVVSTLRKRGRENLCFDPQTDHPVAAMKSQWICRGFFC